ncbi:phenylacetic acid degradation protein PaaN [Pseudidiomarina sediminum]|uniref:Phenylacetic acid degradation protein PaaN n=1 Tax=Pseudidiomarina sediminum TaxID=431675 RepID=A0A432Z3S8_9GAMM|nr:phenylacetic acid degradation protein PaaN [Pseudidiomarina sediminum]RUO72509.1 phenylacetic acid degradation protein PaaN [Pseudidiomarina sediminum]
MSEQLKQLINKHQTTLSAAIEAIRTRHNWSPFQDSPSSKFHGEEKPKAGKAAFVARCHRPFDLKLPGINDWVGGEVSPFTQEPLGITYPACDPQAIIAAAKAAAPQWAKTTAETRLAVCVEMTEQLYARNFEMAHAIMHVAGQSYTQAFSGSGPNALDRGLEALAYAAEAMRHVPASATYSRNFAGEQVLLTKTYNLIPRGIGLVICCASFPTWNAYPSMFASLATGNPVIIKPHPNAILPMAIAVEICREVLEKFGFDANLITLAVDTPSKPIAMTYIENPAVQIIDFTGSPRFGSYLESTVKDKLLFTETAGVNSVVVASVDNLQESMRAIARGTSLFSAQMCTSPQVVYVPKDGIATGTGTVSFEEVAQTLVNEIEAIASNAKMAAAIMGAIQGQVSLNVVASAHEQAQAKGLRILREASPYQHPDFPNARTLSPLVIATTPEHQEMYAQECFGPVLFIVATEDADAAAYEATELARTKGTISCYMYATDDAYVDRWLDAYAQAGANLTLNLTGPMWINFAAAYSDYHVTGLNPAGNACLADLAFVSARFRIVQHRRPTTGAAS